MEADLLWKAAKGRAFPQDLENAPSPPPAFSTAPTAPASDASSKYKLTKPVGFVADLRSTDADRSLATKSGQVDVLPTK
jgi:hypothetical protein